MRLSTILFVILTAATSASAKDVSFTAAVDQTRIALDGQITLTLTVIGEGLGGTPDPQLPPINDFTIIGTNSSSSTQITFVNGTMKATKTVEFIYALRPKQVGTFTIGASTIQVDGRIYSTDPIRVEVVAGGLGGGGGGSGGRAAPVPRQSPGGADVAEMEKNLFLEVAPDRRQVYVGQQVTLTYKLLTRYSLQNVQYGKVPSYTGFWAESLFDAQQLDFRQEARNGRSFNSAMLKRVALFPTTAGSRTLEQMEIGCDIPVRSGNPFDDFGFFGRVQRVTLRSDPVSIEVLPLPPGAPVGFKGAVGEYAVTASATPGTVAEGDPVSVKVAVSGTGNVDLVAEPERPGSREFKVYDPKVGKSVQKTGNLIRGTRTFDYVLIPEHAGKLVIPPFQLAYFDPQKRQYVTSASQPLQVSVSPGTHAEGEGSFRLSREEVTQVGRDIRYIKPDASELEDQGGALYRDWGFLSLQILPLLGLAGALAYRRHLDRLQGDVAYARRRRSSGEAARRLKAARQMIESGQGAAFHAEIHRALAQFLADRLNIPPAGITAEGASRLLAERRVDEDLAMVVRSIFERCDFARFAPGTPEVDEMESVYGETEGIIGALERKI